jgi:SulP family sulfate permease
MAVVMVHLIQKGNEVGMTSSSPIEKFGLQWFYAFSL